MKTQTWHTGNYRAKLANAFVRTARSSLAVSEKIILARGEGTEKVITIQSTLRII